MSATDSRDTIDAAAPGTGLRGYVKRELRNHELETRVSAPGQVVTYDPATQIAQCAVGYLQVLAADVPGAGEVETPMRPDLVNARVALLQGATHSDHPPISPLDTGMLFFLDRALDAWLLGPGSPVDPVDGRAHDMADAVFVPGLAPDARRRPPPSNPAARTIEAPAIALGGAAVPVTGNALRGGQVSAAITAPLAALTAVPPATDPITVIALANANQVALLALMNAIQAAISAKVVIE